MRWRVSWPIGLISLLNIIGTWPTLMPPVQVQAAETQAVEGESECRRFERRQRQMGTEFSITLYCDDADLAEKAFAAAFARIEQLDQILSNYRSDSELLQLSHSSPHAELVPVGRDLWCVLRAANQISRVTDGAFDVTIGPFSKLWRRARHHRQRPDPARLAAARRSVGYQHLQYDPATQSVRLTRPKMLLDLGGIAKGYALDEAMEQLRAHGVSRALINGGGDLVAGQPPPDRSGWRVGIAALQADAPVTQWLSVSDRAVATSGDLWQFVEIDGTRYSHLIDPRTGIGLSRRSSVTVVAPNGMLADAWASAVSVLGVEAGFKAIKGEKEPLSARVALIRDQRVEVHETTGFKELRETRDAE